MKPKTNATDIIILLVLTLITFSSLAPILNTIAISFSDRTSAVLGDVIFWPRNFNVSAYRAILEEDMFFTTFAVSLRRVALGGTINILLCIIMAYPLSKSPKIFKGRNIYMWLVVFTMLFNGGLVPNFILIRNLGLLDTIWALVLPGAVPVFSVILLMNFFKGIPHALEEAAVMDGASPLFILARIFVPLAKPAIATITLFSVVGHWNAFFDGMIFINTPANRPVQTYIQSLTVQFDFTQLAQLTQEQILEQLERSNLTFNAAKVAISMVPILLIYPFLQKYFVTGIVMGAVKE